MSKRLQNKANRNQQNSSQEDKSKGDWKVVITTAAEVNVWSGVDHQYETVFTSGSEGIVSAKIAKEGNVLAVAGSQVVVLHKIEKGQERSYKLRGADPSRLLEYAADGKNIFLTSGLKNCVQSYNVRDDKISDNYKSHPSPITCFASSLDSSLLLSASANPPTIHIDNLNLRTSTQLKPKASDRRVLLASFHPTRKNVFMLAFSDGVLAAYDYSKASKTGQHIHAFGHLHDAMMGGNGITSAEFLSGPGTRAVTGGEDGKCVLLDFDKKEVVGSFHVGAPVSCISIKGDGNNKSGNWQVAIGSIHGWCYIYDQDGTRLHEVEVDVDGERVLEVRWKLGDIKLPTTRVRGRKRSPIASAPSTSRTPGRSIAATMEGPIIPAAKPSQPLSFSSTTSVDSPTFSRSSLIDTHKPLPKAPIPEEDSMDGTSDDVEEEPQAWEQVQNGYTADYMNIFSPVKNDPPVRRSPRRRSARLSIRSANSPSTHGEDRISKLIRQEEEGLLRPSASSPSLAIGAANGPTPSPVKRKKTEMTSDVGDVEIERPQQVSVVESPKTQPRKKEPIKRALPMTLSDPPGREAPKPDPDGHMENLQVAKEEKPPVPAKDNIKPKQLKEKPVPVQAVQELSLPELDPQPPSQPRGSKVLDDFRKVRAKIDGDHAHPVLSLFSSHLPNQKSKKSKVPEAPADGKENDISPPTTAKTELSKEEKKKVKAEEKEQKKKAKEEEKMKKRGGFPRVKDLVFPESEMDIDGPDEISQPKPREYYEMRRQNPNFFENAPSARPKRKATNDLYEVTSGPSSPPGQIRPPYPRPSKSPKGKEKAKSPPPTAVTVEEISNDIWIPEEIRKPPKRVNFGDVPRPDRGGRGPPVRNSAMSLQDMIADLKATFQEEIGTLRNDMQQRFDAQNEYFELLVASERSEAEALREENERLRMEIEELTRG